MSQDDLLALVGGDSPLQGYSSLPRATPLERAALAKALTVDPIELSRVIDGQIVVKHLVIDLRSKKDGEQLTHCVLIDPDGKMYDGSGACLHSSLRSIIFAMGMPPWEPPLPLDVVGIECMPDGKTKVKAPGVALNYEAYERLVVGGKPAKSGKGK